MPGLAIEVLSSGKRRWFYRRKIPGKNVTVTIYGGIFPSTTIAAARDWARPLNEQVEAGIDPREVDRAEKSRAAMTFVGIHGLYMDAVRQGRSSRAKRPNKPRTIRDKLEIFERDIAPTLGHRNIHDITEADLIRLVEAKGKVARIRANRLAAELKVFFGWACSLRGLEVGLTVDPSRRLGDLRFPESPRSRKLSRDEIELFLKALVGEPQYVQRGMLLWLLTAARISEVEVVQAQSLFSSLLVLEQRATSAIKSADRGEAGRRHCEFDAQMSQHTRRDHLNRIEWRSGEPQKTNLQRHAQPVKRPTSAINCPAFLVRKREEMRDFRIGQIVREPVPTKILSKWSVHDSVLPGMSLHSAGISANSDGSGPPIPTRSGPPFRR
jgi:hypothetical protein